MAIGAVLGFLGRGAAAGKGAGAAGNAASGLEIANKVGDYAKNFGVLTDEIIVTVRGNKFAIKSQLYKLAAALAFGQVQNNTKVTGLFATPGMIMMENHLHDICVTFTLRYQRSFASMMAATSTNYVSKWLGNSGASATGPLEVVHQLPVFTGPDNDYWGGKWDFSSILTPNVVLPFNNRSILYQSNSCPDPEPDPSGGGSPVTENILCPNPRPVGDYRSRGNLISLVMTALTNPGSVQLMKMPINPDITNDTFTGGP